MTIRILEGVFRLLSACRRRCFFSVSKVGLPLMGYTALQYTDCYSEPMSTRLLNSISSRICRENTQFDMYTTTSKQQEGCTFKKFLSKMFYNDKFWQIPLRSFRQGWWIAVMFWQHISVIYKVNSNGVCNYCDFIRREGLSLSIWFDIVEFRESIHMTVKIFANVHQLMFLVLKLVWIRIEYSLVYTALNRWCFKIC